MELYKYEFVNHCRVVQTTRAQTLDEALKNVGVTKFTVPSLFFRMAVIHHDQHPSSALIPHTCDVTWKPL